MNIIRKTLFPILLALLLIFAACARTPAAPEGTAGPPSPSGEIAEPETTPAPQAVEYRPVALEPGADCLPALPAEPLELCHLAEMGRLYGRDAEGGMHLLVDRQISALSQRGSLVAYSLGFDGGYLLDLSTGTTVRFSDGYVGDVLALGGGVAYLVYGEEGWDNTLCYYDLSRGAAAVLEEHWQHAAYVGDGDLLVYADDGPNGAEQLRCLDLAAGTELWTAAPRAYFAQLYAQDGSLCGRDGDDWFRMDLRSGRSGSLDLDLEKEDTLLYLTGDGAWVSDQDPENTVLVYADANGRMAAAWELNGISAPVRLEDGALAVTLRRQHSDSLDLDYNRYSVLRLGDAGTTEDITALGEYGKLFAEGDFPVFDGSLARVPVMNQIYSFFCLENGVEGREPVMNNTHGAWHALADRTNDIALLAAPTQEEQDYLAEKGVEVELKLYGGDGLVFIGNKACGVTDLTVDQLKAIYRGEITNWKELGGVDHEIRVMYRNDQSGSQRLFEKMVWKDEEVPDFEALGFDFQGYMSTIVSECIEDPYTFGYSIMTYLGDNFRQYDELQCFSINGFEPVPENIRTGDYIYNTKGYVVIRADEPEGSPARRLSEWFGSDPANIILTRNGISPISED